MSSDATAAVDSVEDPHEGHPSDLKYVQIALVLGLLTAAEVLTYVVDVGDSLVPALYLMMAVKFWLVAGFFMHLKFDSPMFTRIFVAGLVGATTVYIVMLSMFQIWNQF